MVINQWLMPSRNYLGGSTESIANLSRTSTQPQEHIMSNNLVNIDPHYLECCSIDTGAHIEGSLGKPLQLPAELDSSNWATESQESLCSWFAVLTGNQYTEIFRDNTYNSENDFSSNFVFSIFAPDGCRDWLYCDDVFVVIETHLGGDVRGNYGPFQVFRVDDVAESGFLDWTLGWYAEPINPHSVDYQAKLDNQELQRANEEMRTGYTSCPSSHLLNGLVMPNTTPTWSERLNCWVGRLRDVDFAVKLHPQEPFYC